MSDLIRRAEAIGLAEEAIHDEHISARASLYMLRAELTALPSAEAVEVKAEQLPPKVPTEWINDGMVLVQQHDWIEMQKELEGYASAEAVQGWILCSERLPEVGEICLLTVHEYGWNCKDYTRVIIGEYSDNYADHILAWMPLPEPYEPKSERRG